MASSFLLLACVCAVAASIANVQALSAVPPPRWGGNNATVGWSSVGNKTTVQSDGSSATWTLAYYYNSALKASRYSNSNGQFTFACQGFDTQPASSACDMINAPDGHLYILFPTTDYCCKCSPTTVLNPAWMQDGGATFVGETKYNGQLAYTWYKDGSQRNYYVAAADDARTPLQFYETNIGQSQVIMQWNFTHYSAEAPGAGIFTPPAGCGATECPSKPCAFFRQNL